MGRQGGPAPFAGRVESGTGADLGKDRTSSVGCVEFKVPMGQPRHVQDTTGRQAKSSEVTREVEAEDKTSVVRPHPRESHTSERRETRRLGTLRDWDIYGVGKRKEKVKERQEGDAVDSAGGERGRKGVISYVKQDVSLGAQRRSPAA